MSATTTAYPGPGPRPRRAFGPPGFPVPLERTSTPSFEASREATSADGVVPRKYPPAAADSRRMRFGISQRRPAWSSTQRASETILARSVVVERFQAVAQLKAAAVDPALRRGD